MRGLGGRRPETVSAGQAALRVIARQQNSPDVRLGVKWSQVQILSARRIPDLPVPPCQEPDPCLCSEWLFVLSLS